MRHLCLLLLLAGMLGGASPALAEAPSAEPSDEAPTPDEPPGDDQRYDESIVVTATADERRRDQLPASVTVIPREEIEARQATQALDLLRTVPGVDGVRSGSPGKVGSLFLRGAGSTQTLVLWNGIKLNDPYFQGFDWSTLNTDGVERLEVVRGPFSTLYGSEAIGGVVQTLTGGAEGTRLRLEGGEDGYLRGGLSAGHDLGPVRLDLAGSVRRGDGQVENDFYDAEELIAQARWALGTTTSLGVVGRVHESEVGVPFGFAGPTPRQVQDRRSTEIAVPFLWQSGDWSVDAQVSRAELELEVTDPDNAFNANSSEGERTSARVVGSVRLGEGLRLSAGTDWQREEAESLTAFGGLPAEDQRTWGLFGEGLYTVGPWSFDLGVRRDDNDVFGDETTFKAGALVRLSEQLQLHARWGQGFRTPSLGELFFPGSSNPELQPETSESYEVGARWSARGGAPGSAGGFSVGLTGFSTDFDNLVVYPAPVFIPENIGRARSRGAELTLGWAGPALSTDLAFTYQDPENLDTGQQLLRRPERSASLVTIWRPADAWRLHGVVNHVGERPDFGTELDAYTTLQLGASFRMTDLLEPYLRVENLTDEDYEEAAGFPAPGRTAVGGVALSF